MRFNVCCFYFSFDFFFLVNHPYCFSLCDLPYIVCRDVSSDVHKVKLLNNKSELIHNQLIFIKINCYKLHLGWWLDIGIDSPECGMEHHNCSHPKNQRQSYHYLDEAREREKFPSFYL